MANNNELRDLEILNNESDYRSLYNETPEQYIVRMTTNLVTEEINA